MKTLWSKIPDEVFTGVIFSDEDKKRLEDIFSVTPGSVWCQALGALGLPALKTEALIRWHQNVPYFNWSHMIETVGGGTFRPIRDSKNIYAFVYSYKLKNVIALLKAQWGVTQFLQRKKPRAEPLVESVALGLVLQFLLIRLGGNTALLSQWLANPQPAPKSARKILEQIQRVQMERTEISSVWFALFSNRNAETADVAALPDVFWDDEAMQPPPIQSEDPIDRRFWKGLPVSTGCVTGLVVVMNFSADKPDLQALKTMYNASLILLFPQARPDSVEYFAQADALLFAQGGVLSHACTVAREMRIPSSTGLGDAFFRFANTKERLWVTMDGMAGTVLVLE